MPTGISLKKKKERGTIYNNARENKHNIQFDYQPGQYIFIKNKDIKRKLNPDKEGPFQVVSSHTNGTITIRRSPTVVERINNRRVHPVW